MLNIVTQLQPKYYTLINALNELPVYNGMPPATAQDSYIVIGDIVVAQQPGKGNFVQTASVFLDIVIKGQDMGYKEAERVAGRVMSVVHSDTVWNLADFNVMSTTLASKNRLAGMNPTDKVFRVLLRYEHDIAEK